MNNKVVTNPMTRFWDKVEITDSCWNWKGAKTNNGYGRITMGRRGTEAPAHRVSYIIHKGKIPFGYCVCHTCDNPSCVNPEHLFIGTDKDNMMDATKKGRMAKGTRNGKYTHPEATPRGQDNGNSKLTVDDVIYIRTCPRKYGTIKALCKRFGISDTNIYRILNKQMWKHI